MLDDGEKTFDGDNEINTSESKMINISKKAMGLLVFRSFGMWNSKIYGYGY